MKRNFMSDQDDLYVENLEELDEVQQETDEDLEDMEIMDLNEEKPFSESKGKKKPAKKKKFSIHYVFWLVLAVIVIYAIVKLVIWNIGTKDTTEITQDDTYDIESMDYIIPLNPKYLEGHEDDGVTTVVCFGNAPFSDAWGEESNLANLIEKEMGGNAKVYNCSVADSYMSALNTTFLTDYAYDAFSFYWLATVLAVDNDALIDSALNALGEVPAELQESMDTLKSIDFEEVDVVAIMYDASDYLDGRLTINSDNPTDIQHFTGSLTAGIQLIQQVYPHIRIMVMSPTYAYALGENGEYQSSDIVDYGMGSLATYAILESNVCYENSVSYIDNIYASVNADNADDYLVDHIHLNEDGRKLLAKRFVECLNLYKGVAAENAE